MKKVNTDKFKNGSAPRTPNETGLGHHEQHNTTNQQDPFGFEIYETPQPQQEADPFSSTPMEEVQGNKGKKGKKQQVTGKKKTKKMLAITGGSVVSILGVCVLALSLGGKAEEAPVVQQDVEVPVTTNQQTGLSTDVSGLLTLEERNAQRTFEEFKDQYLNLTLQIPSDYYLTEKSHLALDVIKEANGSLTTNSFNGIVQVVELKSKQYADMTIVMQVNHRKDYPRIDGAVQNGEFYAATEYYYNGSDTHKKLQEQVQIAEEGFEEGVGEVVSNQQPSTNPQQPNAQSTAPVTNEQNKETAKEQAKAETDKKQEQIQYVDSLSDANKDKKELKDMVTTAGKPVDLTKPVEERFKDVEGSIGTRTINPDGKKTEVIVKELTYGSYVTTTKEYEGTKLIKTTEITSVPYYLAVELPLGFTQLNDYSHNVCVKDSFKVLSQIKEEHRKEYYDECYTYSGTGYVLKEGVTLPKNPTQNAVAQAQTGTEQVQTGAMKEQGTATTQQVDSIDLQTQMSEEAIEKEVEEQQPTEEEQAELDRMNELLGLDTTEQQPLIDFKGLVDNDKRDLGNYSAFAKRVDLLYLDEKYVAFEYAFSVGANTIYVDVYGKAEDEIYYILEDTEQLIKSLVIL